MKNILNYYYQIIIDDNKINEKGYFSYNNHLFCLYEYKRNINEIEALNYLNDLMLSREIKINKIIKNIFNNVITSYNSKNYVLIMINYEQNKISDFKFIQAFSNIKLNILKRNNWGVLWSNKIDYIEYQLKHLNNSYPLLNSSVNYYIGLAENAISYFNMLDLRNIPLFLSHRRIDINTIYNPLELVIDYKVRDIAEYRYACSISGLMNILEIKDYLSTLTLGEIDYILLYIRLIFPSYYFDLYEEIVNDNKRESEINRVLNYLYEYEKLLFEVYTLFQRKVNMFGIDWINQKFM